jgi:hypothetical protein
MVRNQAVVMLPPMERWICRVLIPFLEEFIRWITCNHTRSGTCDDSKIVPNRTLKGFRQA